ncbi:4778_t:CDS:1, partial [Acaulospora colombiana]
KMIDYIASLWIGTAATIWKNTPQHLKPKTLEDYRHRYKQPDGTIAMIPTATGLYSFIRKHWKTVSENETAFKKLYEITFSHARYRSITEFNSDFTDKLLRTGIEYTGNHEAW